MGYQQWTTGQVLTSAAMNQVGDSTVNVFADSSARSTAISSPSEGMVSYLSDTNQIEIYTGAAWAGIGDITEVAAGANIDVTSGTGPVPSVALAIDAAVSFGVDGTGVDVTLHTGTSGDFVLFDASDKALEFTDAKITMNDNLIETPEMIDYAETVNAIGATGGGTQDIDITAGNVVTATVDTSTNTFTFSNPSATGKSCSFMLMLANGGSQTVVWPTSVDWPGAAAPTLTASGVDVLTFFTLDAGTIWYGFAAGLDMG